MSDELNWEIEVRLVGYARLNIRLVKLYPIFLFLQDIATGENRVGYTQDLSTAPYSCACIRTDCK